MERLQSNLKNMVLSLTVISLVAAGILGVVYKLTEAPIEQAKQQKQAEALNLVLPENDQIDAYTVQVGDETLPVYKALSGSDVVGYAVETNDPSGFNGMIRLMVGFDAEGNIIDYSVLEQGETPGLGAKMVDWFKRGMKGQIAELNPGQNNMTVSKDGGDVDAITAATISSRAFLRAVNKAYQAAFTAQQPADATTAATLAADAEAEETELSEGE